MDRMTDEEIRIAKIAKTIKVNCDLSEFDFENDFRPVINQLYLQCSMSVLHSSYSQTEMLMSMVYFSNARIEWLLSNGRKPFTEIEDGTSI